MPSPLPGMDPYLEQQALIGFGWKRYGRSQSLMQNLTAKLASSRNWFAAGWFEG
ncbi:MAG: hypothetical protein O2890_06870 [Cyanobacteria bacterium]|nr:hypothetical protein [Cyanobacteriota bacterium]MDA0866127.1 hypothetical protein [Cyanobacteriota bacterium]